MRGSTTWGRRRGRGPAALALLLLLAAAAAAAQPVGPEDLIHIRVYKHPELSGDYQVAGDGTVAVPLLGTVAAGGLSPRELEGRLAALLQERGLIRNPQVVVRVVEWRSRRVSVLGWVRRPGRYVLGGSAGLLDLLAEAGGVREGGARTLLLVRGEETLRLPLERLLREAAFREAHRPRPGDVLYVPRAPRIYVQGEVRRPGAYPLEPGMTALQAVAAAGGLTPRGTLKGLLRYRRGPEGGLAREPVGPEAELAPGDTLEVRRSLF